MVYRVNMCPYSKYIATAVLIVTSLVKGCLKNDTKEIDNINGPACFNIWNEGNKKTKEELITIRRNMNIPPNERILNNRLSENKLREKGLEAARELCYPAEEVKEWEIFQAGKYCNIEFYTEKRKFASHGGSGFYVLLDCITGDLVYIHLLQ